MRNEEEMMKVILDVAKGDVRIRGVYMNGSRTNPNARKDIFQDYDIVYVVNETASFIEDENWIDVFGERLYMQLPEQMDKMLGKEADLENCFGYLMQLADGNRLDLHLMTLEHSIKDILHDRLCVILLDKDGILPKIPEAADDDHWVKRPVREEYSCCCNEFWWLLNNIGKGLWRNEIPYVMDMLNLYCRPQLFQMLSWYVGIQTDFSCSIGKSGKYLYRYLSREEYERLIATYPAGEKELIWESVFAMCDLFEETAKAVGGKLEYPYNVKESYNSRLFLDCVCELPDDAEEIIMVRRMKAQDVDEVARIWLDGNITAHSFIPEGYWRENYDKVRKLLAGAEIYVYEDHNGIQGFIGVDTGYIQGIFVKKDKRSKGIGKALMRIAKSKYQRLHLHVYCKNEDAVKFYKREGFMINGEQIDTDTNHSEYEMEWQRE